MKGIVRNILMVGATLALLVLLALLLHESNMQRRLLTCEGLRVEYADSYRFVSEEEVKGYIEKHYGSFIGQRLDSVDLCRVENILDNQGAVLRSEAFTTEDGMLNVRLTQREPVIRLQRGEYGCYVDKGGCLFPLQQNHSTHVPVIDGEVPVAFTPDYKGMAQTPEQQAWVDAAIRMVEQIGRSRTWRDAFVQYHVDRRGDLVLVPREGREKFIIGSPDELGSKLDRIASYYESIKPARDSALYSTVNVKYTGQIICRK